ncbi:RNA polymerase sigma factor [Ruminococcus flavefaciens]|uniref:Sigma-70, region 4 n=1 Tax=Ruminococcus flavefaciens TaxID=1265 RepID=A0A1M7HY26_RUMFL|nr:sigma-70 family RNA polymerase sigma factor [Ruminococcus flavefaciens]SHM33279.1 Sigma-70, region 4 [Ruminococcus flavefaciens]
MNDNEIKAKLQHSAEEGFKALFNEYWSYCYTIVFNVLRGCGSQSDIEDCTSDVLCDTAMNYNSMHEGSLKAYIGTSAKRRAIDVKRSISSHTSKNIPLEDDISSSLPSADNVEADTENAELSEILLARISSLGEPDASIIIHKFFYEHNSSETAKILGMNPITVRSRLRRALKKLKTLLADLDIEM